MDDTAHEFWPSQLNEMRLAQTFAELIEDERIPNISGLATKLIIEFHGDLSSKCMKFAKNDRDRRAALFSVPRPEPHKVDAFTIELWVYVDSFASGQWQTILNGRSWHSRMIHFQFLGNELELADHGGVDYWFKKYSFEARKWYHIAVTYPNRGLYVNGQKISEETPTNPQPAAFANGTFGQWNDSDRMFYGKMKEFRIWSTVRSESELNENMLKGARPHWMQQGLIMYYSFDDKDNVKNLCHAAAPNTDLISDEFQLHSLDLV